MCVCWVGGSKVLVVAFKCVWEHMHVSASLVLTNSIQPSGALRVAICLHGDAQRRETWLIVSEQ